MSDDGITMHSGVTIGRTPCRIHATKTQRHVSWQWTATVDGGRIVGASLKHAIEQIDEVLDHPTVGTSDSI